jgi:hypothetical protein
MRADAREGSGDGELPLEGKDKTGLGAIAFMRRNFWVAVGFAAVPALVWLGIRDSEQERIEARLKATSDAAITALKAEVFDGDSSCGYEKRDWVRCRSGLEFRFEAGADSNFLDIRLKDGRRVVAHAAHNAVTGKVEVSKLQVGLSGKDEESEVGCSRPILATTAQDADGRVEYLVPEDAYKRATLPCEGNDPERGEIGGEVTFKLANRTARELSGLAGIVMSRVVAMERGGSGTATCPGVVLDPADCDKKVVEERLRLLRDGKEPVYEPQP